MTHREANATAPVLDSTDVSEAQAEEVIQPDSVADDLGREAVPRVGGGLGRHLVILT
jgi:hypothetical protein